MNKTKKSNLQLYIIVIISAIGLLLLLFACNYAISSLQDDHDNQISDIAEMVDQNLDNLLRHGKTELAAFIAKDTVIKAEESYHDTGKLDALQYQIEHSFLLDISSIDAIIIQKDEKILASSNDCLDIIFIYDDSKDEYGICQTKDQRIYFTVTLSNKDNDLKYIVLINLTTFYNHIVASNLKEEYLVLLSQQSSGLYLQNETEHPAIIMNDEEVLSRGDGYSILLENQENDYIRHTTYFQRKEDGQLSNYRMTILPCKLSANKVFSIGIAVDAKHIYTSIINIVLNISIGFTAITIGIILLIYKFLSIGKENKAIKEREESLRKQNEQLNEMIEKINNLAHHQRLETIGIMASSISHEFNNLLTPIIGYSLLTMENIDQQSEAYNNLLSIYNSANSAKELISHMSIASRKKSKETLVLLSPDEEIKMVISATKTYKPSNIEIQYELNCPEKCILISEVHFSQIMINLLINAYHAMKQKGGILKLASKKKDNSIIIEITDTGIGISNEVFEHIYEPFYTTKEDGNGLGMAITKQIADLNNIDIQIRSEENVGTTFILTFNKAEKES